MAPKMQGGVEHRVKSAAKGGVKVMGGLSKSKAHRAIDRANVIASHGRGAGEIIKIRRGHAGAGEQKLVASAIGESGREHPRRGGGGEEGRARVGQCQRDARLARIVMDPKTTKKDGARLGVGARGVHAKGETGADKGLGGKRAGCAVGVGNGHGRMICVKDMAIKGLWRSAPCEAWRRLV